MMLDCLYVRPTMGPTLVWVLPWQQLCVTGLSLLLEKSVNKYWVLVRGRLVGGRVTSGLYFYVRCSGWRNSVEWVETRDTIYCQMGFWKTKRYVQWLARCTATHCIWDVLRVACRPGQMVVCPVRQPVGKKAMPYMVGVISKDGEGAEIE